MDMYNPVRWMVNVAVGLSVIGCMTVLIGGIYGVVHLYLMLSGR